MQDNTKINQAIVKLRHFAECLLNLEGDLTSMTKYRDDNDFHFIALCYLAMQKTHLQSILRLEDSRDSILIARAMVEKLCLLLWASEEPEIRGSQWRQFVFIDDWRKLRAKRNSGKHIDPTTEAEVKVGVNQYGARFLSATAQKCLASGKSLPADPYSKNWYAGSIRDIAVQVDAEDLYVEVYKPFSEWVHGSPSGIAPTIELNSDGNISYVPSSPPYTATALSVGFQSLIQTMEAVASDLNPDGLDRIVNLKNQFLKEMSR